MKILILHGPNLNLLGKREIEIYGSESQDDLFEYIKNTFLDVDFTLFQSNHEGHIIDKIHDSDGIFDAIVFNPGAFSHYSYAIRDAVASVKIPIVEVHLSDVTNREDFRKRLVISDACLFTIIGKGKLGYIESINKLQEK